MIPLTPFDLKSKAFGQSFFGIGLVMLLANLLFELETFRYLITSFSWLLIVVGGMVQIIYISERRH